MKKIWEVIGGIGMILLILGAAAMDSECMLLPVALAITGLVMCCASARVIGAEEK